MYRDRGWLKIAAWVAGCVAAAVLFVRCGSAHAATCVPDPLATPTPTAKWDQVQSVDLAAYLVEYREVGGTWQRARDFPCDWLDLDEDGIVDTRWCRGPQLDIALQRYGSFSPFTQYEFSVKWRSLSGVESARSTALPICFSPVCARPGPCN